MKKSLVLFVITFMASATIAQTSLITIGGTGTAATSAHIMVTTDSYRCPDEYVVEGGASLTTWDPSAICDATTSGDGDIALPVELTSFTAIATLSGVELRWITESEVENLGFILERKTGDITWKEIASYKTDNTLNGQGSTSSQTNYEYIDKLIEPNITYDYRLADVDFSGVITYHSVRTVTVEKAPLPTVVEEFQVLPAYPNPFNPNTTITYGLDINSEVIIQIYDISGRLIKELLNKEQPKGWHSIQWNGTNKLAKIVPNGQYFVKIISDNRERTQKLMLLK
ncbi:T9SS type A sorting domain-containing protein [Candidatus Neomarinimicrobiota bacterium]